MSHRTVQRIGSALTYALAMYATSAAAAVPPPAEMVSVAHATAADIPAPIPTRVSFGTLPALQVATPKPGAAGQPSNYVPGDFNGDGTSDLLWFNPTTSQVGYWNMTATTSGGTYSNGTVTRSGAQTYNVTPGYFVGAVGDFNNDGFADLVFTSENRDLWLWTNDQHGHWQSTEIGTYPSQWQLIGAGDIDGDGYDDLLWLDPSECKFAYWTMHGAVRTGYKIIDVACGYYPIGIGYYQPSNRLSILWTSAANDLYVWDSKPTGFVSYNLSTTIMLNGVWAIGGGYMGNGIGFETYTPYGGDVPAGLGLATGGLLSRLFDANGNQTGFVGGGMWDGGAQPLGSAGYVILGGSSPGTALYSINQAGNSISTGGITGSTGDPDFTGNGGIPPAFSYKWSFPVGWWVVGAPANGTAVPPWQ